MKSKRIAVVIKSLLLVTTLQLGCNSQVKPSKFSALGFVAERARTRSAHASSTAPARTNVSSQGDVAPAISARPTRNLSLQPAAFNVGRRLGQRFGTNRLEQSILIGTLTIGNNQENVQLVRQQTNDGEEIQIAVGGTLLTWKASEGAMSANGPATGAERQLIEQLVLDSPDQFVLAQLRGASYYVIARSMRPEGVADNYSGPLWNIVRVDDPERDEAKRPQSAWRLYYINTATGFIDRIVSEIQGQRIVAEISGWTEVNGEKVPSQINWARQGQTLMQYHLTTFTHAEANVGSAP